MSRQSDNVQARGKTRPVVAVAVLIGGTALLIMSIAMSIALGAANIQLATVVEAIFSFNPDSTEHNIIWELRMPRVFGAVFAGACFAVAGALMQGMTRNPLADSGLLGINAGSIFILALCFALVPTLSHMQLIFASFAGATLGAVLVYGIGILSRQGLTPLRLVLAGSAVSALLVALSEGIALYFQIGQELAFWHAGGVSGTEWSYLQVVVPFIVLALLLSQFTARSLTLLSMGDEVAVGLGQKPTQVKVIVMIDVVVLAGIGVSIIGPVGFVGLVVPHITRMLVGYDYRWIIPCSIVLGALLVVLADLLARTINAPYEIPIGAIISIIGVPFFIYLARKGARTI